MQSYTEITSTQTLTASRDLLLNNDKTVMSCSSGTAFPTANLQVGMLCFRTDLNQLYQLKNLTPTWKLIFDLSKTATNQEYVDTNKVALSDVVTTATANKILKLDSNAKLPAGVCYDAAHSFVGNGYQKLSNGLIIQWINLGGTTGTGYTSVTFPIAFPTACLFVIGAPSYLSGDDNTFGIGTYTTSSFTYCSTSYISGETGGYSAVGFHVIAIGY